MLDVDEDSGAKPNLVEGRVVFPHGLDRLVVSTCGGRNEGDMTYNFIVCTARVVGPCGLFHYASGNSLEVHQVVAGRQRRHALNALLARLLLGIGSLLLLFDGSHVDFSEMLGRIEVFVEGVRWVDGVELLGRILAGILEDNLLATRVL